MSELSGKVSDPLESLENHLTNPREKINSDMDDKETLRWLAPFDGLSRAIEYLNSMILSDWKQADQDATQLLKLHRTYARVAISGGVAAIIVAILRLALTEVHVCLPFLSASEFLFALAAFLAVWIGHLRSYGPRWLCARHKAERLRMLKFHALGRPELWNGRPAEDWRDWISRELAAITNDCLHRGALTAWLDDKDRSRVPQGDVTNLSMDAANVGALALYYREKRLSSQGEYFQRKGEEAAKSVAFKLHKYGVPIFVATIVCILLHFVLEFADGFGSWTESVAHALIFAAAVIPVGALGIRAWSAVFELARKARSFRSKTKVMEAAADRLRPPPSSPQRILDEIAWNEQFLEQEHRDWLRLQIDAEWFV